MEKVKKRKPIITLLLSLAAPGLGQIYNGQFKKGIFYLIGFQASYLVSFFLAWKFYGLLLYLIIMLGLFLFILFDALVRSMRLKAVALRSYNKWYIYLIICLVSYLCTELVSDTKKSYIARSFKIPSSAMEPTLLVGDYFVADMGIYRSEKPKRGDIIVFEYPKDPSKTFIKRVIGIPGEKVEINGNKIYINDQPMDDPWGYYGGTPPWAHLSSSEERFGPVVVPRDSLFVLGDNRDNSQDSRFWGFVNIKKVMGKALYLYWAKNKSRIGMKIK